MDSFLTGGNHFGFGFMVGSILMLCWIRLCKKSLSVQLYAPFLPFVTGFIAALPYLFLLSDVCDVGAVYNIFIFYSLVHCHPLALTLFGSLNLVALICGSIYGLIILRYIFLVKYVRRYGWSFKG